MPKLSKAVAKKVNDAESSGFAPLTGMFTVKLEEVKVAPKDGPSGPYWIWTLAVDEDEDSDQVEHNGRKLWVNTSLSDAASWKLKEMFEAFGYTPDSDTEEMIGERCKALLSSRIIESGARKGQPGQDVDRCVPLNDEDAAQGGGNADPDDVF